MSGERADVVVCGAGPAGCALSTFLARAGLEVVVVDRSPVPGDVVGESLLPFGNRVLEALGIRMDGFLRKEGAVFARDGRTARVAFADAVRPLWTHAWQVQRAEFDARLRAAAAGAGVRFVWGEVQAVAPPEVHTSRGVLRGDRVVDAMGRGAMLARSLGIRQQHRQLRNAARGAWYRDVAWQEAEQPGDIVVTAFEGGWFWLIPFADGTTSVGVVTTEASGLRGDFDAALVRCPDARIRLEGARRVGPMRGHQDFTQVSERFWGEGWALVGDAAVFVDPVFSSGVLLGLESAEGLARAILGQQSFEAWEQRLRRASKAFEHAVLSFYDGTFLTVVLSDAARQNPRLGAEITGLLAGDVFSDASTGPLRMSTRLGTLARYIEHRG